MTAEYIYRCICAIERIYDTKDPEMIFRKRGTRIKKTFSVGIRGMICVSSGETSVFIGEAENQESRRVELARLLGHAVLHREKLLLGKSYEDEYYPLCESSEDREANLFAAELLITDAEIRRLEEEGYTDAEISTFLKGRKELFMYKQLSLRCRGIGHPSGALGKCDVDIFINNCV